MKSDLSNPYHYIILLNILACETILATKLLRFDMYLRLVNIHYYNSLTLTSYI